LSIIELNYKSELKRVAKEHGFTTRRDACFRIVGDGIFQVLKFEYERAGESYHLNVGLRSMYDELRPEWFTADGCIPQFSIANFIGVRSANYFPLFSGLRKENKRTIFNHNQIILLQDSVIPKLDQMQTQKDLLDMMIELQTVESGSVRANFFEAFAPYLSCRLYAEAEKVISSVFAQHHDADVSKKRDNPYYVKSEYYQKEDRHLEDLLGMVRTRDQRQIECYLQANYANNMNYAKFCIPPR